MAAPKLLEAFARVDDLLASGQPIPNNIECPIDMRSYQKKLDSIMGLTVDGRSRVRLEWMMDAKTELHNFCGEQVFKHPYWIYIDSHSHIDPGTQLEIVTQSRRFIGIPRFVVTELHERSQAGLGWEQSRYGWLDGVWTDMLGPLPEEGWYDDLFIVAKHDELCCGGKGSHQGHVCYGGFKMPGDFELKRLRKMNYNRDHAEVMTEPLDVRVAKEKQERDDWWRAKFGEAITEGLKPHAWRFETHDPGRLSNGRWHFIGKNNRGGFTDAERLALADKPGKAQQAEKSINKEQA